MFRSEILRRDAGSPEPKGEGDRIPDRTADVLGAAVEVSPVLLAKRVDVDVGLDRAGILDDGPIEHRPLVLEHAAFVRRIESRLVETEADRFGQRTLERAAQDPS